MLLCPRVDDNAVLLFSLNLIPGLEYPELIEHSGIIMSGLNIGGLSKPLLMYNSTLEMLTRSTHVYDASCCFKHHARMGRAAQVAGVARLVEVQRAVQDNSNVKSEPKHLACEESPVRTLYC